MIEFTRASLTRMDTTRLAAYRTNLDFYNGSQWQQTSRHRQLVFNYVKVSVEKITSFLMQGLSFACYPNSTNSTNPINPDTPLPGRPGPHAEMVSALSDEMEQGRRRSQVRMADPLPGPGQGRHQAHQYPSQAPVLRHK